MSDGDLPPSLLEKQRALREAQEAGRVASVRPSEVSFFWKLRYVVVRGAAGLVVGGVLALVIRPAGSEGFFGAITWGALCFAGVMLMPLWDWFELLEKQGGRTARARGILIDLSQSAAGSTSSSTMWALSGRVEFVVDGHSYKTRFSPRGSTSSERTLQRWRDRYPLGMEVTVYYNPDDPKDADTEWAAPRPKSAIAFTALCAVVGWAGVNGFMAASPEDATGPGLKRGAVDAFQALPQAPASSTSEVPLGSPRGRLVRWTRSPQHVSDDTYLDQIRPNRRQKRSRIQGTSACMQ